MFREGGVSVCGNVVLRYFWCGFAEIFILACGIAFFKTKRFSVFTNLVNLDVLLRYFSVFRAVLQFSEPAYAPHPHPTSEAFLKSH